MRNLYLLLIIGITLFAGSCSTTYFYSTISSSDPYTTKNRKGEFIQEGDSIDVIFRFGGENAPVTLSVINKSSRPYYINWRQSGITLDKTNTTYGKKIAKVKLAEKSKGTIDFGRFMSDPGQLQYIRPHGRYTKQLVRLTGFRFHKIPNNEFVKQQTEADKYGADKEFRAIKFEENNTPLIFKTHLTVYEDINQDFSPLFFESEFFLSEVIRSGKNANIANYRQHSGATFRVKHENGKILKSAGQTTLGILGTTAIAAAQLALGIDDEE